MEDNRALKIFVVDDDRVDRMLIQRTLEKSSYDVTLFQNGEEFLNHLHLNPDIVTIDYNMPTYNGVDLLKKVKNYNSDIPTILLSGQEQVDVVVEAYQNGANNYIVKNENAMVELINSVKNHGVHINLKKEIESLKNQIVDRSKYYKIIGDSKAILQVFKMIQKVERSNMLVLITGESGTGKELVAGALHYNSPRRKNSLVTVNMAAIPDDLIESELFGHEKGAFTGADSKRIGRFEEANQGTIFLDEIAEMNMNLQAKLLRVLQEHKINRLGSNKEIHLDVRVIAATNKNLDTLVKEGKFREDLYYRLQGFLINVPPLRERDNDIIILAKCFLEQFCEKNKMENKHLSKQALEKLMNYTFPGNVRELKSLVERAILISEQEDILIEDLVFPNTV